jgi:hypothetical protein
VTWRGKSRSRATSATMTPESLAILRTSGSTLPRRESTLAANPGGNTMPIRPFLSGRAFDPETIRDMSLALERVCDGLGLRVIDDAVTNLVAQKIIELAQRGVKGADELQRLALSEIKAAE